MWILRDNYGNPAYAEPISVRCDGTVITMTLPLRQFTTKADAEAFAILKIVEGIWDEGVWQAEQEA